MNLRRFSNSLDAYQRRAVAVAFLRASVLALAAMLLTAELAVLKPDLLRVGLSFAAFATLIAGLIASVVYARTQMPSVVSVARHLDRSARSQDLFVTALEREQYDDDMSAAITRAASAAITRVPARLAYPLEWPRQWRRWAAVAAVTQVIAVSAVWRAPAERPVAASGASVSVPGTGVGSGGASTDAGAAPATSPAANAAPAPAPSTMPSTTTASERNSPASTTPPDAASSGATTTAGAGAATAPAAAGETANGANRYRQAVAHAGDALTHGRVPAALRGVVERYFTAIRPQGK